MCHPRWQYGITTKNIVQLFWKSFIYVDKVLDPKFLDIVSSRCFSIWYFRNVFFNHLLCYVYSSLPIQINLVCHSIVLHFPCDTSLHSRCYSQVFLGCYLLMISAKTVDLLLHIFSVICWKKSYLTMLSISSWLFSTNGICTRINPLSFLFAL